MKLCFYIVGVADFQDMLPVIIESHKRYHEVSVCIIDCLYKKRQFYYYNKKELIDFVSKVLLTNDIAETKINIAFFGQDDKKYFENYIDDFSPDYVLMQGVNHKFPR
jgi:hypothetical protein